MGSTTTLSAGKIKSDKNEIEIGNILKEYANALEDLKKASKENWKQHFAKANQELAKLVRTYEVDTSYHIFFCPMEKKPWVAKGTEVNNPYAPDEMPHCGELKF